MKPRKKYKGPQDCYNPIDIARKAAGVMTEKEREERLTPALDAFHKLRQGEATSRQWNQIIDVLNAGEALCKLHIGDNLMPYYVEAFQAMTAVAERMLAGKSSTCRASELEAIREGINCYGIQIKLCSRSEYNKAVSKVDSMLRNGQVVSMTGIFTKAAA
jgi:hypothetical protein